MEARRPGDRPRRPARDDGRTPSGATAGADTAAEARPPRATWPAAMGVLAAGAGEYNQETAVARSVNADTAMRWNQYMYQSQLEANRRYQQRMAREKYGNDQAREQIADRLRNNPDASDIAQRQRAERRLRRDQRPEGLRQVPGGGQGPGRRRSDPRHPVPVRRRGDLHEHPPDHDQGERRRPR